MYSDIKWQISTVQNHIYFCTNLIELVPSSFPTSWGSLTCDFPVSLQDQFCIGKQDWDLHQIRYHTARKRSPLFTFRFNRCGLGKKKELQCQRKNLKPMFFCWGQEAQRKEWPIRVTHPPTAEVHPPTSFLLSLLLSYVISSTLPTPFLLYFFLPETILYITFNALRTLVDKVSTGQIWGQLCVC